MVGVKLGVKVSVGVGLSVGVGVSVGVFVGVGEWVGVNVGLGVLVLGGVPKMLSLVTMVREFVEVMGIVPRFTIPTTGSKFALTVTTTRSPSSSSRSDASGQVAKTSVTPLLSGP